MRICQPALEISFASLVPTVARGALAAGVAGRCPLRNRDQRPQPPRVDCRASGGGFRLHQHAVPGPRAPYGRGSGRPSTHSSPASPRGRAVSSERSEGRILMVVRPSKGGAFGHALRLSGAIGQARATNAAICGPHGHLVGEIGADCASPRHPSPPPPDPPRRRGRPARQHLQGVAAARRPRPWLAGRCDRPPGPAGARPGCRSSSPPTTTRSTITSRPLERGLYRSIEIALAPLATRVICVCEAERRIAASIGPSKRTRVVYNGIEPLAPAPPGPRDRPPQQCRAADLHRGRAAAAEGRHHSGRRDAGSAGAISRPPTLW